MCADERLVTILRHHNFLKELQEIAVQGESQITRADVCVLNILVYRYETDGRDTWKTWIFILGDQERAQLQRATGTPTPQTSETTDAAAGEFLWCLCSLEKCSEQCVKCGYNVF